MQAPTLHDNKYFCIIFSIISTHSELLFYYKLEREMKRLLVLGHPVVNSYLQYHSIRSWTEYSSSKKLDLHSPNNGCDVIDAYSNNVWLLIVSFFTLSPREY